MDDKPFLKWTWLHHMTHFKFRGFIYISQWLKLELSDFVQSDYIKSCQRDDK